ncbi:cytochrome P450 [Allorhizocola rhizosphaerae]|uniref:cytochrome P450 n=1 Tax=Allorhizocola rhizosphaerae TaxID=1872709 RepID=UPI001FEAF462|nr:cytochrome P450 [Allorhizocola rhizosphaerae]
MDLFNALYSDDGRRDPYPVYAALRRIGPVVEVMDGFLIATSYAAVDEVLRDANFGVERAPLIADQTSLLTMNPPDHTRVRRLMSGAFTPRRVHGLRDAIADQATALIDAMRGDGGGRADLMADFAYRLPVNVICELLGVPEKDRTWFRSVAADSTVVLEGTATLEELDAARSAGELLRAYFKHLVKARRPGLIADLAEADGLTEGELLGNLSLLLIAGFETTSNLIGNGVMTLLEHPFSKSIDDPVAYVEEFLRYDSPVQLTSRIALAPTVLSGRSVQAGTYVLALIGSANRDEARFDNADRFDPARPNNVPISFGAGAHFCLGAALARLEAQIAFPLLLQGLPGLRLDGTPVRRERLVLRGYESLPIAWN